ncbi:hypothetical protein [Nocardia abscessus]|uniref:hypothetical protein n=1 Tax=Nocardia abscessus TaxID=120957 RepID=UPI002453B899|nr:hypothetical protein [Nocardia abscessus]
MLRERRATRPENMDGVGHRSQPSAPATDTLALHQFGVDFQIGACSAGVCCHQDGLVAADPREDGLCAAGCWGAAVVEHDQGQAVEEDGGDFS